MNKKFVRIDGISVELIRKNIKSIRLKVSREDGNAKVSAPYFVAEEKIISFLIEKLDWLKAQQKRINQKKAEQDREITNGAKIRLLDREYSILVVAGRKNKISMLTNETLLIEQVDTSEFMVAKKLADSFCKKLLETEVPKVLALYESKTGLKSSGFSIRKMKSRWGSCNTQTKKLCFNSELAKKPVRCLEYVVVHEICHLRYAGHKKDFWALVERFCPNYKAIRKELKG